MKRTEFMTVQDVMQLLGISRSKAYAIIRELNLELKSRNYMTVAGRISRKYFYERWGITPYQ